MYSYFISKEKNGAGKHELHASVCYKLPDPGKRIYIGEFEDCVQAMRLAESMIRSMDGCPLCSPRCHSAEWEKINQSFQANNLEVI